MSDLFTPLRDLDASPSHLPAGEVRRHGDRRRRRRVLTQVTASAAAVAAVLVGAGLVVGSPDARGPAVTRPGQPQPSEKALPLLTSLPAGFALAADLPEPEKREGPSRDLDVLPDLTFCRDSRLPDAVDGTTDTLAVRDVTSEHSAIRWVGVYPDEDAADRAARSVASTYAACPRYSLDGGASTTVTTVKHETVDPVGSDGWTITRGYEQDGRPGIGQAVVLVTRVLNTVLIGQTQDEGPGLTDEKVLARDVVTQRSDQTRVVQALCEATGGPCRGGDEQPILTARGIDGSVELGMVPAQLTDSGVTLQGAPPEARCRVLTLRGSPAGQVDGMLSGKEGVAVLFAHQGMRTPEGIRIGSRERAVREAYPQLASGESGIQVPLPGGAHYLIGIEDGVVSQLSLQLDDQDCVG